MKSPVSWVGGKARSAAGIISHFPEHNHIIIVFSGGLHVFFAKPRIKLETVNDLNRDLINFWMVCRDHRDELVRKLDSTPYSRALFEKWSKEEAPGDEVEWAARWFYLQCSHFSAVYHGGWSYLKELNTTGKPPAPQFRSRIRRIEQIKDRFKDVHIECADFRVMFERYGDGPENLLYCDPPYPKAGAFYEHLLTDEDHRELASMANAAKAKIALSYPAEEVWDPLVSKLYRDWIRHDFSVVSTSARVEKGGKKPRATELLLTNYELQPDLFRESVPAG